MDLDNDKYVSKEDFVILADKFIRNGALIEAQGQSVRERVMHMWAAFGVPDDAKLRLMQMNGSIKLQTYQVYVPTHACIPFYFFLS